MFSRGSFAVSEPVLQLPTKCQGIPLLTGDHLDAEDHLLIEAMQQEDTVVNTKVAISTAVGVASLYDANLLSINGGSIDISKEWAKRLLRRMGLVKWQGTTKAKVNPEYFETLKKHYLANILA